MARGKVYKRVSGNWAIDYSLHGRRIREVIGPSKKVAETVLAKRLTQIAENRHLDVKRTKAIKFKEFADIYLETYAKPNKRSWKKSDQNSLRKLVPEFGQFLLQEITPDMIERYKANRRKAVSAASVNRELACLKCMFSRASDWEYVTENPCKKVKLFPERNQRRRYLSKEELQKLLEVSSPRLKSVILTAVYTGMRKGELQKLQWQDIYFDRGYILLRETKNGEERMVPICDDLKKVIISIPKHPKSSYLFVKANGDTYDFRKAFETALERSGIEDFRFHDLRHTCASYLAMAGVDLNVIRELLGHKSLSMTLRYSHLSQDHKMRAVQSFNGIADTNLTPQAESETVPSEADSLTALSKAS